MKNINQGQPYHVLEIVSDSNQQRFLRLSLESPLIRINTTDSALDGITHAHRGKPSLIITASYLSDLHWEELVIKLREFTNVPIVLLLPRETDTNTRIKAFNTGVSRIINTPFNSNELAAEIYAALRDFNRPEVGNEIVVCNNIEIDLGRRLVRKNGKTVDLTKTEWILLQKLAENSGKVMLSTDLLEEVWGDQYDLQYLRVWISRLRSKLEENHSKPTLIKNLQGIGYILVTDDGDPVTERGRARARTFGATLDLPPETVRELTQQQSY